MKRREFAGLIGGMVVASIAPAQLRTQSVRVAAIGTGDERSQLSWPAFRGRLRELRYVEGRNLTIESRWSGSQPERLEALAVELVALKPDAIVAMGTPAALAAKKATASIPIVAVGPADPVRTGLVASLARPGGNLTGVSPRTGEIASKWIEFLLEIAPGSRKFAYLADAGNPASAQVFRELREKAATRGATMQMLDGNSAGSTELAFRTIAAEKLEALIVSPGVPLRQLAQVVESAARQRVPAIYGRAEYPEAGGLISYGTDYDAVFVRAADYVHRILEGTKPAELPYEEASKFKLVVNLKAAKNLSLVIPQSILLRADRVIE